MKTLLGERKLRSQNEDKDRQGKNIEGMGEGECYSLSAHCLLVTRKDENTARLQLQGRGKLQHLLCSTR